MHVPMTTLRQMKTRLVSTAERRFILSGDVDLSILPHQPRCPGISISDVDTSNPRSEIRAFLVVPEWVPPI